MFKKGLGKVNLQSYQLIQSGDLAGKHTQFTTSELKAEQTQQQIRQFNHVLSQDCLILPQARLIAQSLIR